jgi:biopolymer transport protein ExbB
VKTLLSFIVVALFATNLFANANSDLEEAYEKEFAFLVSQKQALTKRLNEFETEAKRSESKITQTITILQDRYITKTHKTEKLSAQLFDAQSEASEVEDNGAILEATLLQADASLRPYAYKMSEAKEDSKRLATLFSDTQGLLKELISVRKSSGKFYLESGEKVDGEFIKVGNIATFGVSATHSGALAPAGGGHLKLWNKPASATAEALQKEEKPLSLNIFIYESITKEIEAKKEKTVKSIIDSGGYIGWVIVGLGGIALLVILLRALFLMKAGSGSENEIKEIKKLVKKGHNSEALELAKETKSSTCRVMTSTLRNIDRDREHLEDIISESILHESDYLDRFGSVILIIAAVAPLLGLLGTVTGMISTFDLITEFGTGDPKMLSGGISEALVTTELGLIVAIPALVFGNLMGAWAERIKNDMEKTALSVINTSKS